MCAHCFKKLFYYLCFLAFEDTFFLPPQHKKPSTCTSNVWDMNRVGRRLQSQLLSPVSSIHNQKPGCLSWFLVDISAASPGDLVLRPFSLGLCLLTLSFLAENMQFSLLHCSSHTHASVTWMFYFDQSFGFQCSQASSPGRNRSGRHGYFRPLWEDIEQKQQLSALIQKAGGAANRRCFSEAGRDAQRCFTCCFFFFSSP